MPDRPCDIRGCVGKAAHRYVLGREGVAVERVDLCGWHAQVTTTPDTTPPLDSYDAIVVRQNADGTLTADLPVPRRVGFSPVLLEEANGSVLSDDGDTITLSVSNGAWVYRVVHRDSGVVVGELDEHPQPKEAT